MKLSSAILCLLAAAVLSPVLSAQTSRSNHSSIYSSDSQRKYNFALITRDGDIASWGSWETDRFQDFKGKSKDDALYVKKDSQMYVITDARIVGQAKKAIEPVNALGKQQGELGREQGKLGAQQGRLGGQQGEYGRQMGIAANEMAGAGAERGETKFQERMKALSKEMQALGKQQAALGDKQKALGARQKELGKRQAAAAKEADDRITKLIDEAFARGLVKKV